MSPAEIDYNGITGLVVAIGAVITIVGGLGMQIATFIRQGHTNAAIVETKEAIAGTNKAIVAAVVKVDEMHDLVNGKSEKLMVAIEKVAFSAGEKAGIAGERAAPMVPAAAELSAETARQEHGA